MELFALLVAWSDHIGGVLALHEVDERYATSSYDLIWAQVYSAKDNSEASVTAAKAEASLDPKVIKARQEKDEVYARRKVLGIMSENLERDTQLVSRELTRRLGREPTQRRSDRWKP